MTSLITEDYKDGYYHFSKDLKEYPDCWCYVVWSARGPGKTYSLLRYYTGQGLPFIYMKRTKDDIDIICMDSDTANLSPYKDINRDFGTNIHARGLHRGIAGFYNCDEEGEPYGAPVSYAVALNAVGKVKGIGLSECEAICFDEFIPQPGEVIRRAEGRQLLDLYMTVRRDRVKRGRQDLKLILFANANEIWTPVTEILEITDDMAALEASGETHKVIEGRGIMLHRITTEECPVLEERAGGIYDAMKDTAWGRMAFGGEYSFNDFSNVKKISTKKMQPLYKFVYQRREYSIYLRERDAVYYITLSGSNAPDVYDLDKENDQKAFFIDVVLDLRNACIDGRAVFETYTAYNLIMNYKKLFTV